MKSNKININPAFEKLFSFKSQHEKNEHNAQMISFRILSEVEKICEDKKIRKKDLAKMVGTTPSYITQLFRGTKQVNTEIMARLEDALGIYFTITANEATGRYVLPSVDLNDLIEQKKTKAGIKEVKSPSSKPKSKTPSNSTRRSKNTSRTLIGK